MVYGVLLRDEARLDEAHKVFKRFQIRFQGLDRSRSVAFRFTDWESALRGLQALTLMKIRAKIIYHIH